MYGYPLCSETDWLPADPKPARTVSKSIIAERGPDAERLMEAQRQREELKTGKPHRWAETDDAWQLVEGEPVKERVVVKRYP